jgi:hypothetical protein
MFFSMEIDLRGLDSPGAFIAGVESVFRPSLNRVLQAPDSILPIVFDRCRSLFLSTHSQTNRIPILS